MSMPVFFVSHGGGPWPWLDSLSSTYTRLRGALSEMPQQVGERPQAILMISAHWEQAEFTLMSAANPGMLYDYRGFPAHTYSVSYPAPGAPWLADRIRTLLLESGINAELDDERGFDHGMFCPMVVAYPAADIPVIQLSLKQSLDPREHIALGNALAPLRDQGILIIGSGLSYHNLARLGPEARQVSADFDGWIHDTLIQPESDKRQQALIDWEQAPSARDAHPREEHLLPLLVAAGAAGNDKAHRVHHESDFMGGVSVSNYLFTAD